MISSIPLFAIDTTNTNINKKNLFEIDTGHIYMSYMVDVEPKFPGDKDSIMNYIQKNFILQKYQLEYEGVVCVCFVVNMHGDIQDIYIPGNIEPTLFLNFFIDFFGKMPKWNAGSIKGIKVKTKMCMPFIIKLK
jgi:hypothetical protein